MKRIQWESAAFEAKNLLEVSGFELKVRGYVSLKQPL